MAHASRSTAAADTAPLIPGYFDFNTANAAFEAWLQAQQQQWNTLLAVQRSMADMQQEWFDQWVAHWGGGVPIDS